MTTPLLEPAVEAAHLRRLIETQPACVMRVGTDALLLAVNDAALSLLGARTLSQALGLALTDWMPPNQHPRWREFAALIASGTSASFECELKDQIGGQRTTLFHGVPLLDHPDGIPSMVVSARDITDRRRLEASLHDLEAGRRRSGDGPAAAHAPLGSPSALHLPIDPALEQRQSEEPRQPSDRGLELARLRQTLEDLQELAERHQLELLLKKRETARLEAEREQLTRDVEAAGVEQKRLAKAVADQRVELDALEAVQRQLLRPAACGRVAANVGRVLAELAQSMDDRAKRLLSTSPLEAVDRGELELLTTEAIRVQSIARELVAALPNETADIAPPASDQRLA